MKAAAVVFSMLMLAGCGEQSATPPAAEPPPSAPSATRPDEPATAPFYVGRWAAAETACGHAAWDITEQGLKTSGGHACEFKRVTKTTPGVEIDATCTGEGATEVSTIHFSYAQSAQALLVDAEPFANVGLVACEG